MGAYFPFWSLFLFFLKTIFSLLRMSSTKWTETLTETSGSLALWAPAKDFSSLGAVFRFLWARNQECPHGDWLQDGGRAGSPRPASHPCTFPTRAEPLPAAPQSQLLRTISGIQAWQKWKQFILAFKPSTPISPREVRDAVTWMI